MFGADLMPRTYNPALEQTGCGFNRIRVHVANGVDAILVPDGLVLTQNASIVQGLWVSSEFIRHNHVNLFADVLANVLRQCAGLHVLGVEESQCAATLPDADDNLLLGLRVASLVLMTALLAAYKSLVNFYRAIQLGTICGSGHCSANPMAEIPCGLVTLLTKHPVNLASRDAF